jgi:DNA-binding FadR family transcriptional regulator
MAAAPIPERAELMRRLDGVSRAGVRESIRKLAEATEEKLVLNDQLTGATVEDWELFGWFLAINTVVKRL